MLAIYEDHPWANRDRVPMSVWRAKLLMLEKMATVLRQAMGFCFEAGADEDTHFRATSLRAQHGGGGRGIITLPALWRRSVSATA